MPAEQVVVRPPGATAVLDSGEGSRYRSSLELLAFTGAAVFAFSLPWERSFEVQLIGSAGRLLGIVAFALVVLALFDGSRLRLRRPSVFLALGAAFTLWAIASVFWSVAPSSSVGRASTYAQLLAMTWLFWQVVKDNQRQRLVMQMYVLGCYVAAAAVAIAFLTSGPAEGAIRYTGLNEEDQNYLAARLVLAMPMAWLLVLRGGRSSLRLLNLAYLPLCLLVVGLTASRGALLMSVVALLTIPFTLSALALWKRVLLVAVLSLGVFMVSTVLPEGNIARLAETPDRIAEGRFTAREHIWRAGLQVFLSESTPVLTGLGSGTFRQAVQPELGTARSSHNAYLSVLVELGLVGIVLFLAMLFVALGPMTTLPAPERWAFLFLGLALLVAMSSLNWDYERPTWFVLALLTTRRAWMVGTPGTSRH
jgi:O-antigen ligase